MIGIEVYQQTVPSSVESLYVRPYSHFMRETGGVAPMPHMT